MQLQTPNSSLRKQDHEYLLLEKLNHDTLKSFSVSLKRHSALSSLRLAYRIMGLWTLLEGFLLLANALAILNEDRFLAPRGWSFAEVSGGRTKSLKGQLIGLIYATQYLRLPLIVLNAITIVVKLVSG
ncbi:hypothetical protein MKW98_018791 [Papaver atlanticum]|uniref:Yos1-like protein n=1 Tax=Papaver atlanticum TaxID=357466 RepID=A0AAD4T5A3_9MAGN|nr:hypothetical protein MKW98_018791 [Papaver atlanticum]